MTEIRVGKYRHYKGNDYTVLGVGIHHETHKEFVVYRQEYNSDDFKKGTIWIREKENFLEKVNVNGTEVNRFEFLE